MSGSEEERGFGPGVHVLIELQNGRRLAGNVLGWTEDGGLYLMVTHRESRLILSVTDEFRAGVREVLDGMSEVRLRLLAVRSGLPWLAVLSRAGLTLGLVRAAEKDVLEDAEDGVRLRELSVPVKTWIDGGSLMTMESTEDTLVESGVAMLEQALGNILRDSDSDMGKEA